MPIFPPKISDIEKLKPHEISRLGIARTFQSVKVFSKMSVFNNVLVGYLFGRDHSTSADIARRETSLQEREQALSKAKDSFDHQVAEKLGQERLRIAAAPRRNRESTEPET
jgi:branched-chain amino acid transport system ATP-binding protein